MTIGDPLELPPTMLPNSCDIFLEAVNAAVTIEEPADVANTLLQITTAMFDAGNDEYAYALLQKTFRRIQELDDPKERAYLLRLFVTLQCRQGLIDAAVETLPLIDDPEQRAIALKESAIWQALAGRPNDALKTADAIEDLDDYEEVLVAVGIKQAEQGLVSEAEATAEKIESEELRIRLLRNIAGENIDVEETNKTIESAREIDDLFHRSTALREIGITLHQNGKATEALAVFKETLNTVQRIRNTYSRTVALTEFADRLVSVGNDVVAIKVFRLAVTTAQEIDDVDFAVPCLCKIAGAQATTKLFDEALDTVKVVEELRNEIHWKSPERGPLDRDLAAVIGKLAVALEDSVEEEESIPLFQKALDIAHNIADAQCRAVALMRLACASGDS